MRINALDDVTSCSEAEQAQCSALTPSSGFMRVSRIPSDLKEPFLFPFDSVHKASEREELS